MTAMEAAAARWATAKPLLFALAIGLVAGPLVSNYPGWQVWSGTAQAQARAGVVEQGAMFCEQRARADVAEPGKLEWSARNELAKRWSIAPGAAAADSDVASACARKLAG